MQLFALALVAVVAPLAQAAAVPSSSSSSSTSADSFTWRQVGCVASSSRSHSSASASSSSSGKPGWTQHCLERCGALSPNRFALVQTTGNHSRCACPEEQPEVSLSGSQQCADDDAVLYVRETLASQQQQRPQPLVVAAPSSSWSSFSLTNAVRQLFAALMPTSPSPSPLLPASAASSSAIVSVLEARAEALSSDIHDLLTTIASHELEFRSAVANQLGTAAEVHSLRLVYILEEQLEEVMKERRRVKRAIRRLERVERLDVDEEVLAAVEDMYVGGLLDSWRADERGVLEVDTDAGRDEVEDAMAAAEEDEYTFQPLPGRYGRKRRQ